MKNLKRFDEFSREVNEYYSGLGGYATRGSYGYEPPSSLGGFKDTFGTGKKLFGAGGILGRDRDGLRGGDKEAARKEWVERVKGRWNSKKGFLDHLMGKGGKGEGGEAPEDFKGGDVSRLKGLGGAAAGAGAAAADSGDAGASPSGGGSAPSSTPPSLPPGMGVTESDSKWKALVAAMMGVSPKPAYEKGSDPKFNRILWAPFQGLAKANPDLEKDNSWKNFPLFLDINSMTIIPQTETGSFDLFSTTVETKIGEPDDPKDMAIAEKLDEFWRKKGYRVHGPKKDLEGKPRTEPSKYAAVKVYYGINDPIKLKNDIQEMLNKFGVITSSQRQA